MRVAAIVGVAAVLLTTQAGWAQGLGSGAANLRDWSGPYAGVGLSYSDHKPSDDTGVFSLPSASGAELNLLLGYSWQSANIVYGIEAVANLGDSVGTNACCQTSIENSWIVRGRVGYATGNLLFFGTVGVASDRWSLRVAPGGSASIRYQGLALGAGAEVALSDVLSLRGELEHINFESRQNATGGGVDYETNAIRLSVVRSF